MEEEIKGTSELAIRIAKRIVAIRKSRGITQKQLAELSGMSAQTVNAIETGKSDYRLGTLGRIEKILQCTLLVVPNEDLG